MRIASLLPSTTEIAYALGLGDNIVGVSHECDYPEQAKSKPVLTRSKINTNGTSNEINNRVLEIVKQGLSVYEIYENKIRELNPDIILTQDQCEVCAVSLKDVQLVINKHVCNAKIISLKPEFFKDILDDILTIGKATNKENEARDLIKSLKDRINYIKNKTEHITNKPKVCCIEWLEPLMVAGNWTPEIIELAGGTNIMGEKGKHTKTINIGKLLENQPDKIIITPCGFKIYQTMNNIELLTSKPEWKKLNAVINDEVYVIDGNSYMNRPSQRIVDTLEILAAIIHPEVFEDKKELSIKLNEIIIA